MLAMGISQGAAKIEKINKLVNKPESASASPNTSIIDVCFGWESCLLKQNYLSCPCRSYYCCDSTKSSSQAMHGSQIYVSMGRNKLDKSSLCAKTLGNLWLQLPELLHLGSDFVAAFLHFDCGISLALVNNGRRVQRKNLDSTICWLPLF